MGGVDKMLAAQIAALPFEMFMSAFLDRPSLMLGKSVVVKWACFFCWPGSSAGKSGRFLDEKGLSNNTIMVILIHGV